MRRARLLVPLLAVGLLLPGCSGGDDDGDGDGPGSQEVTNGTRLSSTWPLTGLPVQGDANSAKRHPVMVLKMDNSDASAPQVGLDGADLVVEELVEGGITRLAVLYYSDLPDAVGPVRSVRATDIGVVTPVDGALVTSGGAQVTLSRIADAGVQVFSEGSPGFYRESSRSAPYNLFTSMSETATAARSDQAVRPPDYLPWGTTKDLPKGQPATGLAARFSAGHTTTWSYRDGRYVNENTHAAQGQEFPADSVLVLRVPVGDAGYRDPAGNPVPETTLKGRGKAMLFHNGRLVQGTWVKPELSSPLALKAGGSKLTVPAGRVWIELVPAVEGDVAVTR